MTVSDKKGQSITKELKEKDTNPLLGIKLGSEIDASIIGLAGKIRVTGGSDKSGVPMRADIHGASRKYVLLSKGVGVQNAEKGERIRKLVRGDTISEEIYQVNCKYDGEIKIEKPSEKEPNKEQVKKKESEKKEKQETKKE